MPDLLLQELQNLPTLPISELITGAVAQMEAPDLEKITAWRERRLVFREDSLRTMAEEFSRYNRRAIIIEAPA